MSGDTAATTPEDGGSSSCSESALGERPFLQQHSASATLPTSRSENSQSSLLDERGREILRRSHSESECYARLAMSQLVARHEHTWKHRVEPQQAG